MTQEKASELITENGRDLHGLCRCFALNNINGSVYHPQMKSVFPEFTVKTILSRLPHLREHLTSLRCRLTSLQCHLPGFPKCPARSLRNLRKILLRRRTFLV